MLRSTLLRNVAPLTRGFSTTTRAQDVAKLTLIGRLGLEPTVRQTRNGKDYALYKVATSDPIAPSTEEGEKREETTSWHTIFAYGPAATRLAERGLEKGSLVYVEAGLTIENQDLGDGQYKSNVFAHHQKLNVLRKPNPKAE